MSFRSVRKKELMMCPDSILLSIGQHPISVKKNCLQALRFETRAILLEKNTFLYTLI